MVLIMEHLKNMWVLLFFFLLEFFFLKRYAQQLCLAYDHLKENEVSALWAVFVCTFTC